MKNILSIFLLLISFFVFSQNNLDKQRKATNSYFKSINKKSNKKAKAQEKKINKIQTNNQKKHNENPFGAHSSLTTHMNGQYEVELEGFYLENGYSLWGGFGLHFSNRFYGKAALEYEREQIQFLPVRTIYLNLMPEYTIYGFKKRLYFNAFLGLTTGLEMLKTSSFPENYSTNVDTDNKLVFGFIGGIETEFFINDSFAISMQFNHKYYTQSRLGTQSYLYGLGVKYVFF